MASECFVTFKDRVPSEADLQSIALNFVGPSIGTLNKDASREGFFLINIKGTPSFPFKGLSGALEIHFAYEERWIEFDLISGPTLVVQTRVTDEFTSSLARSIAQCIARYYQAEYDPGG